MVTEIHDFMISSKRKTKREMTILGKISFYFQLMLNFLKLLYSCKVDILK